jgi:hypothetical protein
MGEFVAIMLALIFFVTPKDVDRVQIWPYADDQKQHLKELSLTFRKTGNGWCPDDGDKEPSRCVTIADGKWVDAKGKVLLELKGNLTITQGTNYVFKPKDWENPLKFSVREGTSERSFEIQENGKTVRTFRVKMWKSK